MGVALSLIPDLFSSETMHVLADTEKLGELHLKAGFQSYYEVIRTDGRKANCVGQAAALEFINTGKVTPALIQYSLF